MGEIKNVFILWQEMELKFAEIIPPGRMRTI